MRRGQHRPPHAVAPRAGSQPNIVGGSGYYLALPPGSPPHTCQPPIAHLGCCDGSGLIVSTGEPSVCISGLPAAANGPVWVCAECGTGWKIAAACDNCHANGGEHYGGGQHTVGVMWRQMSPRELRRFRRRAEGGRRWWTR